MIIGVNLEGSKPEEATKAVQEFTKEKPFPYPCVIADESVTKNLPKFEGIPTWFFIDREGKLRYQKTGAQSPYELDGIIEALLKQPAKDASK